MKFHPPKQLCAEFQATLEKKDGGAIETEDFAKHLGKAVFAWPRPLLFTAENQDALATFVDRRLAPRLKECEKGEICEHWTRFQPTGQNDVSGLCQAVMRVFPTMHPELLPTAAPAQWGMFVRGYLGNRRGQRVIVISPFDPATKLAEPELELLVGALDGLVRERGMTALIGMSASAWERCRSMPVFSDLDPDGIVIGAIGAVSPAPPKQAPKLQREVIRLQPEKAGKPPKPADIAKIAKKTGESEGAKPPKPHAPAPKSTKPAKPAPKRETEPELAPAAGPIRPKPTFLPVHAPVPTADPAANSRPQPQKPAPTPEPAPKPIPIGCESPPLEEMPTAELLRHLAGRKLAGMPAWGMGLAAALVGMALLGFLFAAGLLQPRPEIAAVEVENGVLRLSVSPDWLERHVEKSGAFSGEFALTDLNQVTVEVGNRHVFQATGVIQPPENLLPVSSKSAEP